MPHQKKAGPPGTRKLWFCLVRHEESNHGPIDYNSERPLPSKAVIQVAGNRVNQTVDYGQKQPVSFTRTSTTASNCHLASWPRHPEG